MIKKVAIIGSRELACNLADWINSQIEVKIIGIVAPPFEGWWKDRFREFAISKDIKVFESIEDIITEKPDIIFSINYWKKIDKKHINELKGKIVNIHHSYKLKYKGRYSTSWAIIHARKLNCWEHGTTLHYIDEQLDEGRIIASYKCEITEDDTGESLFEKVELLSIKMFKDYFHKIINDDMIIPINPDPISFFHDAESNKNLEIPYGLPIEEVYDFVRAWTFKDRPRPYFKFKDKRLYLDLKS